MSAGELPRTPEMPGDVPERFSGADEVQTLVSQMVGADSKRNAWRSTLERLRGGEPVYPLELLKRLGQSWRARTNYRGLEGMITTENTLDYDLETQGEAIVDISLDLGSGQQIQDWERVMEEQFKWLMQKRWKSYNYHICKRHDQKNLFGLGAHVWPKADIGDWIPRTPSCGEILFPENCPFNFDEEGDYFMLRDFLPTYVLQGYIRNPEAADNLGWDVDVVWKALTTLQKSSNRNQYGNADPYKIAKLMNQGDLGYWATRQSGVWINSIFCRELETGNVSQYSIAEGLGVNDYIYKKRNKYKDGWPLELFPYDIGNGAIQSVKGLGDRTKEFFEMLNRMLNSAADQVMLGAYPSMKQLVQNMDPDKMKLARVGGLNWLPFGCEPSLIQFPDLNKGPLALIDKFEKTMQDNNRGAGISANIEQQDRMTMGEYAARSQDINHMSSGSEAMQKVHISSFYSRIVRLCAKPSASDAEWAVMAREWRDRCVQRGVDPEAFKHIAEVTAVLAYGKGSSSARISNYLALFQTPAYLQAGRDRQIAMERGYVAAMFGEKGVEQYCASEFDKDIPNNDEALATVENNGLVAGGDALAAPDQEQKIHLDVHFGKITPMVQAYQQGQAEMQPTYTAVFAFGQHIKQHLDLLQQNPLQAQAFKQYYNEWQALGGIADKLRSDIESAQQAQPPEEQVSDKLKIGMANVQATAQIASAKAQAATQLKFRQQAAHETLAAQKLAAEQARENAKTVHGIRLDTADTVASIAQDHALTQADIAAKNAKAKATNGAHK